MLRKVSALAGYALGSIDGDIGKVEESSLTTTIGPFATLSRTRETGSATDKCSSPPTPLERYMSRIDASTSS